MESGEDSRLAIGQQGEELVCKFLQNAGHTILERNWRSGHLEVDIISFNADGIHFVEVKTRRKNIQAPPQDSVRKQKQRNIVKAAQTFLRSRKGAPYGNHECIFDVVAVTFDKDLPQIDMIPQAYIPLFV